MKALAKSLWIFREKIVWIEKEADNPFYKSKYADLASVLEWIKEPMKVAGLAITHSPRHSETGYNLVSTLIDIESGESVTAEFPIFWQKPQEVWSSISYARRYNILALLDIPTLDDDDGNKANDTKKVEAKKVYTPSGSTTTAWFNKPQFEQCIQAWNAYSKEAIEQWATDNGYKIGSPSRAMIDKYLSNGEL